MSYFIPLCDNKEGKELFLHPLPLDFTIMPHKMSPYESVIYFLKIYRRNEAHLPIKNCGIVYS